MKISKLILGIVFILFFKSTLFGQIEYDDNVSKDILSKLQEKVDGTGEIIIFQDMRINELVYNHIEQNKRKGGVPGYRIRIFSDIGTGARDASQKSKARFYELFPEIPIYIEYDSPYFKVYVGDFRTKIDALKEFNRIKRYFRSAFIVPDKINYPDLEE